jgi:DNA (cytosine-5)-methyltransferase 1
MPHSKRFGLREAAAQIGVAPITLRRWLLDGKVSEVPRNRNGWRVFSKADIHRIQRFAATLVRPKSR